MVQFLVLAVAGDEPDPVASPLCVSGIPSALAQAEAVVIPLTRTKMKGRVAVLDRLTSGSRLDLVRHTGAA